MENVVNAWPEKESYQERRVLITGHNGFKGTWLSHWLSEYGAKLYGLSLPPEDYSFFHHTNLDETMCSYTGDVGDTAFVRDVVSRVKPDIIFHLAAEAIVNRAYQTPVETYRTNVMGTVNILHAAREQGSGVPVVVVTTDKCYQNEEWLWPYRETDRLGGADPYSSSKACAELVTHAFAKSYDASASKVVTCRAGNVVGPGDWAPYRLVPDIFRALKAGTPVKIRNPRATRPWQHVLEPLRGYLVLGQKLLKADELIQYAWNFGPFREDSVNVKSFTEAAIRQIGSGEYEIATSPDARHEAMNLALDWSCAKTYLSWSPAWRLSETIAMTIAGYKAFLDESDVNQMMTDQLVRYEQAVTE